MQYLTHFVEVTLSVYCAASEPQPSSAWVCCGLIGTTRPTHVGLMVSVVDNIITDIVDDWLHYFHASIINCVGWQLPLT